MSEKFAIGMKNTKQANKSTCSKEYDMLQIKE